MEATASLSECVTGIKAMPCAWPQDWLVLCKSVAWAIALRVSWPLGEPPPQLAACRLHVAKRSVWTNQRRVSKTVQNLLPEFKNQIFTEKSGFLALFENWESGNPLPPPPFPQGQQSAGPGSFSYIGRIHWLFFLLMYLLVALECLKYWHYSI